MMDEPVAPKRAVIADDDDFFRLALAAVLTRHCGFDEVVEADSLDEAFARLGESVDGKPFSLAIFDLDMDGMAGAGSLAAVRDCFPDITTVVMTASRCRQDVLVALEAGAHGYITKGLGVPELVKIIDSICAGTIHVPAWLASAPLRDEGGPGPVGDPVLDAAGRQDRDPAGRAAVALTPRQEQVLRLVVAGSSNKEVARTLGLSQGTVKVHVAALFRAFGAGNRAAVAASGARYLDIVSPSPGG